MDMLDILDYQSIHQLTHQTSDENHCNTDQLEIEDTNPQQDYLYDRLNISGYNPGLESTR